jgi:hypothetical protein
MEIEGKSEEIPRVEISDEAELLLRSEALREATEFILRSVEDLTYILERISSSTLAGLERARKEDIRSSIWLIRKISEECHRRLENAIDKLNLAKDWLGRAAGVKLDL